MSISNYIKTLTELSGISGFEFDISDYLVKLFNEKNFEASTDALGNVIACKKSVGGCGKVMLEAHMDEIGMIVNSIDKNGFLTVVPIGGIDPRILYGKTVIIHGDEKYYGVFGAKPPHVITSDDMKKTIDFNSLFIDVGMSSEEANKHISIGSCVTFHDEYTELLNDNICAKCLDDRAAISILLSCIDKLSDIELGYDLYICCCTQEEVGLRGAATAAYAVNPDFAVAIDVTHATTPDSKNGTFNFGCGPVICKGPNIHPMLVSHFIDICENKSVAYEIEVEGGNTGTDAWAIQTAREGIPTMLLSVPIKYMHSPVESLKLEDCEVICDTLCDFLKSFERTEDIIC